MSAAYKYTLIILSLLLIISCSSGSNGTQNTIPISSNHAKVNYQTIISSLYQPMPNPMPPKDVCPFAIESTPPPPQCSLLNIGSSHTQITNGCDFYGGRSPLDPQNWNPDVNPGLTFARSVVDIDSVGAKTAGTGTIIGNRWILTAAHVLVDKPGLSNGPIYVLPWQRQYNGIALLPIESIANKFLVKAIYYPANYAHHITYPGYGVYNRADYALLELESDLPDIKTAGGSWYQSIPLESQSFSEQTMPVWSAGYGDDQNQQATGVLHYRQIYYLGSAFTGINIGLIYTVGTLPVYFINKDGETKLGAWSFIGPGDSGGPVFYYDYSKKQFSILGVLNGGSCGTWAGYFAQLPYSTASNTSVPEYYESIAAIMNNTAAESAYKCISPYPSGCTRGGSQHAYIVNKTNGSIETYLVNSNSTLTWTRQNTVTSGISWLAADPGGNYLYAAISHFGVNGNIAMFKQDNGILTALNPPQILSGGMAPINMVFGPSENKAYVTNLTSNNVTSFTQNQVNGSLTTGSVTATQMGPASITFTTINGANFAYIANNGNNTISIFAVTASGALLSLPALTPVATGSGPISLSFDPTNKFAYVTNNLANSISAYRLLPNGQLILLGTLPSSGEGPVQLKFIPTATGTFAYVSNARSGNIAIFRLNPDTGELRYIDSLLPDQPNESIYGMTVNTAEGYLYLTRPNKILVYKVTDSGTLTNLQTIDAGYVPGMIILQ